VPVDSRPSKSAVNPGTSPLRWLALNRRRPIGLRGPPAIASTYNLPWLLRALTDAGLLGAAAVRDIAVRAPQVRARLMRQQQIHGAGAVGDPGPVELVAAFGLNAVDGSALDEDRLTQLVAERVQLPYLKIDPLSLDMAVATATVSSPFALRHVVLPLRLAGEGLEVAVENPFDHETLEHLAVICKRPLYPRVASRRDILKSISEIYGFRRSVESAAAQSPVESGHELEQLIRLPKDGAIEANDQHVVNAVNYLFAYAYDQRASDVHIEPQRGHTQVRLRIDGTLHNVHTVPRRVHAALTSRIKTLARLDVVERRRPQDGRIKTRLGAQALEMRLSTLPTALGEKLVLRLFDPHMALQTVETLGFEPEALLTFKRWMQAPHGLILLTGPTGSGKTTTLYATLHALAATAVNVTTIEDPIEMLYDGFNQVAVNPKVGLDFPTALRSILRQDPDIIMVGEIRDGATAQMAVQAALTGHLVFSTLHTNDSLSAVTRLQELGVAPFLVGSVLVGAMAQRLVRRLCPACAVADPDGAAQFEALTQPRGATLAKPDVRRGRGCGLCRHTGFRGREGLFELLPIDTPLGRAIATQQPMADLDRLAASAGRVHLEHGARAKVARGVTSFAEYLRIVGPSADGAGRS
jgi:general secretion pathway protein E